MKSYRSIGKRLLLLCAASLLAFLLSYMEQSLTPIQPPDPVIIRLQRPRNALKLFSSTAPESDAKRIVQALQALSKHVRENPLGSNRGDSIDAWNRRFGFIAGPWCASGLSNVLRGLNYRIWTARAIDFIKQARQLGYPTHNVKEVLSGDYIPQPGDIAVKGRPGGNHVDVVVAYLGNGWLLVIGCNVNDQITLRKVRIEPFNKFTYSEFITPL